MGLFGKMRSFMTGGGVKVEADVKGTPFDPETTKKVEVVE